MIPLGIGKRPLGEQAFALAAETPTVYSDNTQAPFTAIGMRELSNEELGAIFENKKVLDIGSGTEGVARRLFEIFGNSELAPQVINLNPQLGNPSMRSAILDRMKFDMEELYGEDYEGYIRQRKYAVGVVQDLPFEDGMFDIQVSTWGFPKCIFDCWDDYFAGSIDEEVHAQQGYREIFRTQASRRDGFTCSCHTGQRS